MTAGAPAGTIESAFELALAGDVPGAIAGYRRMLESAPRDPELHTGLGQLYLLVGDWKAGWEECEWRSQRTMPVPRWRGEPLKGDGILIHGEQGYGDNFQFVRYAAPVAERGGRVVVATREGLRPLLATVPGVSQVVEPNEPITGVRWHLPMLSLPAVFATGLDTVPAQVPYLSPDPARVAAWRARLAPIKGLRVGLVWSGHTAAPYNWRRSPGLKRLAPLFGCEGVHFFGLQMGGGREELSDLPAGAPFTDLGPEIASFAETAAAMQALDLIVTPCTATAHLAGALARPVWVLLSSFPDWRWLLERDTSPWYPTARLFRQPKAGDWDEPVARLKSELVKAASGGC